jgi:hypothetical protein
MLSFPIRIRSEYSQVVIFLMHLLFFEVHIISVTAISFSYSSQPLWLDPIQSIITSKFPRNCTLFLLQIGYSSQVSDGIEPFLEKSLQDHFVIQTEERNSNTTYFDSVLSNKLATIVDLHRNRNRCIIALHFIVVPSKSEVFSNTKADYVYDHTSKWTDILRKDEDLHLFIPTMENKSLVTQDAFINSILVSSRIAEGIKQKSVILLNLSESEPFRIFTTCLYCNQGKSTLFQLKMSSPESSSKLLTFENFHGKTLKVSAPTGTKWIHEIGFENGIWVPKRGMYKIVLDHLMIKYNFSCQVFRSRGDGGTGRRLSNGSWVGSVGDVLYGEAHLGQTTGQLWERNKIVGFTHPISYETLSFTCGEPLPFYSWKAMFWPLSVESWISIGISFIIANSAMALLATLSQEPLKYDSILCYTFGTLFEQEILSAKKSKGHPLRIFMAFWLIFTLVTTTAYRSKLVTSIAFPLLEETPKTFEQLSDSNYKIALYYLHGAAYNLLKTSPNPTYGKIFKRMELEEDDVKCYQRAIGEKTVCISWVKVAEFVYRRNLSDRYGRVPLRRAADTTCFLSTGIVMERRAIFQSSFNSLIFHATDTGLLDRWTKTDLEFVHEQRRSWEKESNATGNDYSVEVTTNALKNRHFRASYYLLVAGSLISLCIFIGEYLLAFSRLNRGRNHFKIVRLK